jgi:hypothetical protein
MPKVDTSNGWNSKQDIQLITLGSTSACVSSIARQLREYSLVLTDEDSKKIDQVYDVLHEIVLKFDYGQYNKEI